MTPLAGQAYIETNPGTRTFVLHCGSGVSDPSREVQYRLNGAYRKFEANVIVSEVEAPEDQTQFQVFADGVRLSNIVIDGKNSRSISTEDLNGAEVLALRLTCERNKTVVIIEQARVSSWRHPADQPPSSGCGVVVVPTGHRHVAMSSAANIAAPGLAWQSVSVAQR